MSNKSLRKALLFFPAALMISACCSGCSKKDKIVIRVLSAADYIYECDQEGYYCEDCGEYVDLDTCTKNVDEEGTEFYTHNKCECPVYYDQDMMDQFIDYMDEKYKDQGLEFDYVYDTFDTPETCYNEMLMGKSQYDVINVSDYTIQKMITNGLVQDFTKLDHYKDVEESLKSNISKLLWGDSSSKFNNIHPRKKEYSLTDANTYMDEIIADYAVPYMWGTIGVMWNPSYKGYKDFSIEDLMKMFSSWKSLYDEKLNNSFFIKDSVRDTYAVSVIHAFQNEIEALMKKYHINETPTDGELEAFNREFTVIFNRCDDQTLAIIKDDMNLLKENAFGFEVDSGKTDMVAGVKVGADICWSGDAAWAILEAQTENNKEIYFSMPTEGSNIWTDAWAIPTKANYPAYALDFIDFMSQEDQAISNMDSVFYTTATATEGVLDYFREMFDVRNFYNPGMGPGFDDEYVEPEEPFDLYDASYFFKGTIDDTRLTDARWGTLLHAWTLTTEEIYDEEENVTCATYARVLPALIPDPNCLHMLCVMDDYGIQNQHVLEMWQQVRTNKLPAWALALLIVEVCVVIGAITYFAIKATQYKRNKANRLKIK